MGVQKPQDRAALIAKAEDRFSEVRRRKEEAREAYKKSGMQVPGWLSPNGAFDKLEAKARGHFKKSEMEASLEQVRVMRKHVAAALGKEKKRLIMKSKQFKLVTEKLAVVQ